MIWSIGWKNVWRNKVRSFVVIIAVMLGIFGGIMAIGIMQGWMSQRIHEAIHNEISHVQIHNPDFLNNEEIGLTINNYEKVKAVLDTANGVVAYSERVKIFAMAQTDWSSSGIIIKGIDPEQERRVSEIQDQIIAGSYFERNYKMPSIVIGSKLAENLKLKNYQITPEKLDSIDSEIFPSDLVNKLSAIGNKRYRTKNDFEEVLSQHLSKKEMKEFKNQLTDYFSFYRLRAKITLTVLNKEEKLVYCTFRVRGIFKTSNSMFDGMTAFVNKETLNGYSLLNSNEVHEIAIMSNNNDAGYLLAHKIAEYIPENSVLSWKKVAPEIAMYADFGKVFNYVYVIIILLALAFGIINTMLMSILERFKELGMLMAIGMNKTRLFLMIMLESVFLSISGAIVGMIFSGIIIKILGNTGINFGRWAEGFEAIGYSAVVYPYVTSDTFIGITVLVILTGIIASIWPARKALKLNPCEALRIE